MYVFSPLHSKLEVRTDPEDWAQGHKSFANLMPTKTSPSAVSPLCVMAPGTRNVDSTQESWQHVHSFLAQPTQQ